MLTNKFKMSLTANQQQALQYCLDAKNVFITGPGGVGKSFLTHQIVTELKSQGKVVKISASTGVAATLINGQTLHSLLGLGLAEGTMEQLVNTALRNRKLVSRWANMDVLVIDEVSMIDPVFFTKLDAVVTAIRAKNRPSARTERFGGLQVILVGDFFQLPPVRSSRDPEADRFIFQTDVWKQLVHECVELTEIFRQDGDSEFAQTLRRVRTAELTPEDIELLQGRVGVEPDHKEGIQASQLYSRRNDVLDLNTTHLMKLDEDTKYDYSCSITTEFCNPGATTVSNQRADMKKFALATEKNMQPPRLIEIREGAQVMMLVNSRELRLANGSRGVVIGFEDGYPLVRFNNITTLISPHTWTFSRDFVGTVNVSQVPLQLAWAVTIHKSQGTSLDCAEISLDRSVFEYGQAYVALSRVRSLEGLKLTHFDASVIRADPLVKEFYASMNQEEPSPKRVKRE